MSRRVQVITRPAIAGPNPMVLLLLVVALMGLAQAGCTPARYADPIAVMLNRSEDPARRVSAARQAQRDRPDDPARLAALRQIVWSNAHPVSLRILAVDQLVAFDEQAFHEDMARDLTRAANWQLLDHLFDLIVKRQWTDMTPALVRHYALTAHGILDQDRAERKVLEALNPGKTADQVVFEVFANAGSDVPMVQQAAAWHLLTRLHDRETLMRLLAEAPDRTALVVDLKAVAADLKVLPTNREGALWLAYWRDPARADLWRRLKDRVGRLNDEQRAGLELRHLPVLLAAEQRDDRYGDMSRAALLRRVGATIAANEHHLTGPTYDGPMQDYPQQFSAAAKQLVWADLVVIDMLWTAVRQPDVVADLFRFAEADTADDTTEYGGALDWHDDRFRVTLYMPMMRRHDLIFFPPQQMIEHLYTGLAHFHFHAQQERNSQYAGPGRGDLRNADRLNFNFLIFTRIDRDRLNVDYHQPGGAVVDLGTLRR